MEKEINTYCSGSSSIKGYEKDGKVFRASDDIEIDRNTFEVIGLMVEEVTAHRPLVLRGIASVDITKLSYKDLVELCKKKDIPTLTGSRLATKETLIERLRGSV